MAPSKNSPKNRPRICSVNKGNHRLLQFPVSLNGTLDPRGYLHDQKSVAGDFLLRPHMCHMIAFFLGHLELFLLSTDQRSSNGYRMAPPALLLLLDKNSRNLITTLISFSLATSWIKDKHLPLRITRDFYPGTYHTLANEPSAVRHQPSDPVELEGCSPVVDKEGRIPGSEALFTFLFLSHDSTLKT